MGIPFFKQVSHSDNMGMRFSA